MKMPATARTTAKRAPSPSPSLSELIAEATLVLKSMDETRYADVIKWMLAEDKHERIAAKPVRRQKQVLYSHSGRKIELFKTDVKRMEGK